MYHPGQNGLTTLFNAFKGLSLTVLFKFKNFLVYLITFVQKYLANCYYFGFIKNHSQEIGSLQNETLTPVAHRFTNVAKRYQNLRHYNTLIRGFVDRLKRCSLLSAIYCLLHTLVGS